MNDQTLNSMELEIEKHRQEAAKEMYERLNTIFMKPKENLTKEEKGFIQARRAYLTHSQQREYADVLAEDLTKHQDRVRTLDDLNRGELEQKAREIGIEKPEELKNRQAVLDAVRERMAEMGIRE